MIQKAHPTANQASAHQPGQAQRSRRARPRTRLHGGAPHDSPADPVAVSKTDSNLALVRCLRILIIDGAVDTAHGLARLPKLLDNDIRAAYVEQDEINQAIAFRPEFILLDIGLPAMDGTRHLRREAFHDSVIIAITAYDQDDDVCRSWSPYSVRVPRLPSSRSQPRAMNHWCSCRL
jgi:PleD family two-component response regulator